MKVLQEIYVPHESVNDQKLIVVGMNFKTGDKVKKDDVVIELETSKAIVTLEAAVSGYIVYHCDLNDDVEVNRLVVQITDVKQKANNTNRGNSRNIVAADSEAVTNIEPQFSKRALALLNEKKLSKHIFKGQGFITEDTILNYLNPGGNKRTTQTVNAPGVKRAPLPNVSYEKLSAEKRREIEYLSSVQGANLVSTLYIDINTAGLIGPVSNKFRYFKESILPLLIFEAAKLLLKYPQLNAFYDDGQIATYKYVNIGIAIDIEDSLKVVNIPETNKLDIFKIEENIFELSNKYIDKKLKVADLTNITFTVTDISSTEVNYFAPLINKDNAAILGVSKIDETTNTCTLSLAFDHRVTTGKYAGSFLTELKTRIESYAANLDNTAHLECYKCLRAISEDLNDIGFIKVMTKKGERLICDACLMNG